MSGWTQTSSLITSVGSLVATQCWPVQIRGFTNQDHTFFLQEGRLQPCMQPQTTTCCRRRYIPSCVISRPLVDPCWRAAPPNVWTCLSAAKILLPNPQFCPKFKFLAKELKPTHASADLHSNPPLTHLRPILILDLPANLAHFLDAFPSVCESMDMASPQNNVAQFPTTLILPATLSLLSPPSHQLLSWLPGLVAST